MTKIIGILNITPDSFSDGGKFNNNDQAINHVHHLIESGTNIIDIGTESTRPGATLISEDEEWQRMKDILPEIMKIASHHRIEISIDTRNVETARKAIDMGVHYINDISALATTQMIKIIEKTNTKLIITHNLGIPANSNYILADNIDLMTTIITKLKTIITILLNNNIAKNRIIIDPGIGFGKNAAQSWHIIKNIDDLKSLEVPICVGHSRKSMFNHIPIPINRDNATLAVSLFLFKKNIDYIRIHNVKLHTDFLFICKELGQFLD